MIQCFNMDACDTTVEVFGHGTASGAPEQGAAIMFIPTLESHIMCVTGVHRIGPK